MTASVLTSTRDDLTPFFKLVASGKVRDLYEIVASSDGGDGGPDPGSPSLLFVATDRVSAYDVVMKNGIPDKGRILTRMSRFWFDKLPSLLSSASGDGTASTAQPAELETHFISLGLPEHLLSKADSRGENEGELNNRASLSEIAERYRDRSMLVRKLKVLPIESIVRGYITGSAWAEYKKSGTVHGIGMKDGLRESEMLEQPLWTPSTKAAMGEKDENISPKQATEILGKETADQVAALSIAIYKAARDYALARGIIIADTKFEFGLDESVSPPQVVLVDEVLTPDSSRFWDEKKYKVGQSQDSLDKQFLRDWLVAEKVKGVEGVEMTDEVVARTRDGYVRAYYRLTGDDTFGTGEHQQ